MVEYAVAATLLGATATPHGEHVAVAIVGPDEDGSLRRLHPLIEEAAHIVVYHQEPLILATLVLVLFVELVLGLLRQLHLLVNHLEKQLPPIVGSDNVRGRAPAQSQGKEGLGVARQLQAILPVAEHLVMVGGIVVGTHAAAPFRLVGTEHRVLASDDDAAAVGHLGIALDMEESLRARIVGRPQEVGAQTNHQLEQPFVGLRPNGADGQMAVHTPVAPLAQRPLLSVDGESAVFHLRNLQGTETVLHHESALPLRRHTAPPNPRRDTGKT